jgi:hypothetical protein
MKNIISDVEVDVVKFHKKGEEIPVVKRMLHSEFMNLKRYKKYYFRAYQKGFLK